MKQLFFYLVLIWSYYAYTAEHVIGANIGKYGIEIGLFKISDGTPELIDSVIKPAHTIENFTHFFGNIFDHLSKKYSITISRACFGVSGNTNSERDYIQSPHLPYAIDGKVIAARCKLKQVLVVNDFEILGYGLAAIDQDKIVSLHHGMKRSHAPQLIIGAGGGLGSALMVWDSGKSTIE